MQGSSVRKKHLTIRALNSRVVFFFVFFFSPTGFREMTEKHGSLHAKTLTLMNELALVGGPSDPSNTGGEIRLQQEILKG